MYILVSPFSKTFDEVWLIYFVPDFLSSQIKSWQIVEIPVRESIEIAVVLQVDVSIWDIPEEKIKSIVWIKNENIYLSEYQFSLIPWMAKNYFTAIHNVVSAFFPRNLREKIWKETFSFIAKKEKAYNYVFNNVAEFSAAQQDVYNSISTWEHNKYLLHGVTWSGKTEIYIQLIQDNLEKGKQSLLLIPEIILTNQISDKIKKVFWEDVFVLNSTVTEAKKTEYWRDIYNNNAKIVVATRSGLLYPFTNLWLIIIDEEHDNSYISEQAPRFHALDLANEISDYTGCKLLLWSGTPSVKSMYSALKGKYKLVSLLEKFVPKK